MPASCRLARLVRRAALTFCAVSLAASLPVLAQAGPAPSPPPRPGGPPMDFQQAAEARFENMKQALKLSPEQEAQIKPILAENAKKLSELRDKYQGQTADPQKRIQMREEMQVIRKDTDDRIAKVLTASQLEEWTKLRTANREQMRQQAREQMGPEPSAPAEPPKK